MSFKPKCAVLRGLATRNETKRDTKTELSLCNFAAAIKKDTNEKMKKLTKRERARKRGLAELMLATSNLTDSEIAKELGIPVFTLTAWKTEPYFKSMVRDIRKCSALGYRSTLPNDEGG